MDNLGDIIDIDNLQESFNEVFKLNGGPERFLALQQIDKMVYLFLVTEKQSKVILDILS